MEFFEGKKTMENMKPLNGISSEKALANVMLRDSGVLQEILITDNEKPTIDKIMIEKWQTIIDLIAKIINVPSALIMQVTTDSMRVFVKSNNPENPYPQGGNDNLGNGLYCETVLGTNQELLINNSLHHEKWKDNPDVGLNMVSYLGLPLQWPDQEYFGTICVLDSKTNNFSAEYRELLYEFKLAIERDLELLCYHQELIYYANMDTLTSVMNRRKLESILKDKYLQTKRSAQPFTITIMDINHFKKINDNYGHNVGDEILKAFAKGIHSRIRETDYFGRWGGDEFLLICSDANRAGTEELILRIKEPTIKEMGEIVANTDFCYGISQYEIQDNSYQDIVTRADREMYLCKENKI